MKHLAWCLTQTENLVAAATGHDDTCSVVLLLGDLSLDIREGICVYLDLDLDFFLFFFPFFFCCCCCLFRAAPVAYGGSQARGQIGAIAAGLHHSHSNAGSQPCLRPTPQLMATLDP